MKIQAQLDYNTILRNAEKPVHLLVQFSAEEVTQTRPEPVALCVVLDRSGSMHGAPLENAKKACEIIVRNLRQGDYFSLICFDNGAEVVIPLDRVRNSQSLVKTISKIETAGSTNMTAGWMLGRDELRKAGPQVRRRLLILTDGHLNMGIIDPAQVARIVASGLEADRVRTTTVGFGVGYDEKLLSELAKVSGGNFHDADSPEKLPLIFEQELEGLKAITAQNLRLRIGAMDCCERWAQLSDYAQVGLPDGRTEIMVGDLTSGEERALVLQVKVLCFPALGPRTTLQDGPLIKLEILWDEIGAKGVTSSSYEQLIRISATQNPDEVRVNEQTVSWIAVQKAGKALSDAGEDARNNQVEAARQKLREALESILAYKLEQQTQDGVKIIQDFIKRLTEHGFNPKDAKEAHYSAKFMSRPSTSVRFSSSSPTKPSFSKNPSVDEQIKKPEPPSEGEKKNGEAK